MRRQQPSRTQLLYLCRPTNPNCSLQLCNSYTKQSNNTIRLHRTTTPHNTKLYFPNRHHRNIQQSSPKNKPTKHNRRTTNMAARHHIPNKHSLLLENSTRTTNRTNRTMEKRLLHIPPNKQRRMEPIPLLPIQLQQLQQHTHKPNYTTIPIPNRH